MMQDAPFRFLRSTLGILAGNGALPMLLAAQLHEHRIPFVAAGLAGQTKPEHFPHAVAFKIVPIGAFKAAANFFFNQNASHIFFAGGIQRKGAWHHARPDLIGAALTLQALFGGDDSMLRKSADAFYHLGIEVLDPSPFLENLFVPTGHLAGPKACEATLRDLAVARDAASAWGAKDKGQAAAARRGRVIGREDRDGTDALIAKINCPGAVLVKMVKPGQDRRFDLPVIGVQTILCARDAGIKAVGVESDGVVLLNKNDIFNLCNAHKITLLGLSKDSPPET